jgi:hypothetical protein
MYKAIDKACSLWHEWRYGTVFMGDVKDLWFRFNRLTGFNGNPQKGVLYEYLERVADDRTRKLEELRMMCLKSINGELVNGESEEFTFALNLIKIIDEPYTHKKWREYSNRKTYIS